MGTIVEAIHKFPLKAKMSFPYHTIAWGDGVPSKHLHQFYDAVMMVILIHSCFGLEGCAPSASVVSAANIHLLTMAHILWRRSLDCHNLPNSSSISVQGLI